MASVNELGLTGRIVPNNTITGHVSAENSLQAVIAGDAVATGHLAVGSVIHAGVSTFIIVDQDGNEIPSVLVDEEIPITATTNDIRKGVTAITNEGVVVGEKEIPSYYTNEGYRAVSKGSPFIIPHVDYDYTKLQAVICRFNTSAVKSVATIKVALENNVYDVDSTTPLSTITKDDSNTLIDFGITNDTNGICIIRYFMYKEIY